MLFPRFRSFRSTSPEPCRKGEFAVLLTRGPGAAYGSPRPSLGPKGFPRGPRGLRGSPTCVGDRSPTEEEE